MSIEKLLPEVQKNILLKKYTTFKIGGPAKYFFTAKAKEDLVKAIKAAKRFKLPFFILGKGSNILFSDKGYSGLVVKIENCKLKIENCKLYTEAGTELEDLVNYSARASLAGLEWAAGVPGTIGGAVYGNAQAFGMRIADIVKSIEVFDVKSLKIKKLSKKQCHFSTKNSIFKKNKNFTPYRNEISGAGLIILSATLKLKKGDKKEIQKKIKNNLAARKKRHLLIFLSAGSVFVNKEIRVKNKKLLKEFPELKEFNKWGTIPSAYLIEKCGLKGKKIGGAKISEKHANFIVNLGKAKAKDVKALIKLAKQKVKRKFGIVLEEEIEIINT